MYLKCVMKKNNPVLNTIGFRIATIFAVATLTIFIVMGLVIHQLVTHHFEIQDKSQLQGKIQLIQNLLVQNPNNTAALNLYLNDALVGHHDLIVQVERPIGNIIFSTAPHDISYASIKNSVMNNKLHADRATWFKWHTHDKTYRILLFKQSPIYKATLMNKPPLTSFEITVGIDTSAHSTFLNSFRWQLAYIGLAGTLCLMILGWLAAWKGLQPIQKMTKVAEGISAQSLQSRLDVAHLPTELQALAVAFNAMLDRLEQALARLSDFSSDLAHEMRTPINTLMTQTQVCLSRSRNITDYQEVLFSNLEEFERLSRTVSDMLFLAKSNHGMSKAQFKPIDLAAEISALFEFYDALAAEKSIQLVQTGSGQVMGDPALLRRALNNLLSNAVKYGHAHSVVKVECEQQVNCTIFSIQNKTDKTEQLSAEQLPRLFDRFYRTDSARHQMAQGTGLGLAITKSILDMHDARITANFANGQIQFTIMFNNQL